ncbi:uncharacterized protein BKCO1_7000204 [Diplodia corticola]|uniref:Uncharacterized protein n=1 Tax=Diplodia corticola TaxID=236234 RepID=A0A1J9RAF2_9PEZI|nr:uncharacterized protein BKCO1_7000204 [Diplodia corticola]OJD37520.1 hypothetical protein BKCO1_7000204 [Diplodia corticola]
MSSRSTTTPTTGSAPAPVPFASSIQYPLTLDGTRLYLRDVQALVVYLWPPLPPAHTAGPTIMRFIHLITTGTGTAEPSPPPFKDDDDDNNNNNTATSTPLTTGTARLARRPRDRFYVLALGHFPTLRRLLLGASIESSGRNANPAPAADGPAGEAAAHLPAVPARDGRVQAHAAGHGHAGTGTRVGGAAEEEEGGGDGLAGGGD